MDRVSRSAGSLVCMAKRKEKKNKNKKEEKEEKEGLRKRRKEGFGKKDKGEENDYRHMIRRAKVPPPGHEPPLPKDGCVPVFHMVLHWGTHQALARALMDSGTTIPLMSLV